MNVAQLVPLIIRQATSFGELYLTAPEAELFEQLRASSRNPAIVHRGRTIALASLTVHHLDKIGNP